MQVQSPNYTEPGGQGAGWYSDSVFTSRILRFRIYTELGGQGGQGAGSVGDSVFTSWVVTGSLGINSDFFIEPPSERPR